MKLLKYPEDREKIDQIVACSELASLLIPSPREAYVKEVCEAAKKFGFAAVLATPYDCAAVKELLEGTAVEVVCINALTHALDENLDCRVFGIQEMLRTGIRNFELSVPLGLIKDGKYDVIETELSTLIGVIHEAGGRVSVILETNCMDKTVLAKLTEIAIKTGAEYLRICSGMEKLCGMNGGRATLNSICYVHECADGRIGIKAGGGWDYAYLEDNGEYIAEGAVRTDAGPRLVEQLEKIGYRR